MKPEFLTFRERFHYGRLHLIHEEDYGKIRAFLMALYHAFEGINWDRKEYK